MEQLQQHLVLNVRSALDFSSFNFFEIQIGEGDNYYFNFPQLIQRQVHIFR